MKISDRKPIVVITMGDVNGIGPEILAKALARPEPWACCTPVVAGSIEAYREWAAAVPGSPSEVSIASPDEAQGLPPGTVPILDGGFRAPPLRSGVLDPAAGRCAMEWVRMAVAWVRDGLADAVTTCPINKECVRRAGYEIAGHTDFIASLTGANEYRMCLFAGPMRVMHLTAHMSLRDAIAAITRERIVTSVRLADAALRGLEIARPRIAVAGLNPHAGEAGAFGREELEIIAPAVSACQQEGIACSGPLPPDTLFGKLRDGHFDMVLAMYHDQGHIPVKLMAMDEGVNVTLGIPIIRTSVDHGTAYDIAGKGVAREHSLVAAICLAAQWASARK